MGRKWYWCCAFAIVRLLALRAKRDATGRLIIAMVAGLLPFGISGRQVRIQVYIYSGLGEGCRVP